jgi:hypothetical protein
VPARPTIDLVARTIAAVLRTGAPTLFSFFFGQDRLLVTKEIRKGRRGRREVLIIMTTNNPIDNAPEVSTDEVTITPDVSTRTLDTYPARALNLLKTIASDMAISTAMSSRGYSEADQNEGWSLLHAATLYGQFAGQAITEAAGRKAIEELDAADEAIFRVISATLGRRFPEQGEFVLAGIGAVRGAGAVLHVGILLERLDQLESGQGREAAMRARDQAALTVLASRGITADERARLRKLVETAKRVAPTLVSPSAREEQERKRIAGLVALRDWFQEWSEIARVVVKRRDVLIRMGLANQRRAAEAEEEEEAPAPATGGPTQPTN